MLAFMHITYVHKQKTGIAVFLVKKKSKAIPVTGLGGLYGCEMLRIPH
jgi:hypothetical protein